MDEGWWISHKVAFGGRPPEESTHDCEIEFEGIFDVHPDFPADRIEDLVRTNGGAILYSAVREWVMNLSARSKHGPFEMPTIDAPSFIKKSPDRLEGISRE